MTTIAYKSNIIAFDSRVTEGSTIYSDKGKKAIEKDGFTFILGGNYDSLEEFIDVFLYESDPKDTLHVRGFVHDKENDILYETSAQDGVFSKEVMDRDTPWAVGSGSTWAIAAMDFKLSAEKAVKYAMTRDCLTGGEVHVYKLT